MEYTVVVAVHLVGSHVNPAASAVAFSVAVGIGAVRYVPSGKADGVAAAVALAEGFGEAVAVGTLEAMAAGELGAEAGGETGPPLHAVVIRAAKMTAILIDFIRTLLAVA